MTKQTTTQENSPPDPASSVIGVRDIFAIRNFQFLWLGQIISNFGDSMTNLALLILINRLTGSTAALATMAIILAVPSVTVGMLAGVYIDRFDRKRIMLISDLLRGGLVLGFVLVQSAEQVWLLYLLGFLQATAGTFFTPARSALLPNIVPKKGLLSANSISETSRIIFGLLGMAAAGGLLGMLETVWPIFAIDAATFFASFLLISRLRLPAKTTSAGPKVTASVVWQQFVAGLGLIFNNRPLLGTIVAAGVTMLGLGAVNILLVPLLINDLQVPETWFAGLEFAQTLSMILSGGLVAVLATRFKPPTIITAALFGLGIAVALISTIGSVWHMIFILFGIGWLITPLQASIATISQTAVSDDMRGRSSAAGRAMVSAAQLLSMGLAGVLADMMGVRNVFILSGGIVILAGLAAAWVFRGYEDFVAEASLA